MEIFREVEGIPEQPEKQEEQNEPQGAVIALGTASEEDSVPEQKPQEQAEE